MKFIRTKNVRVYRDGEETPETPENKETPKVRLFTQEEVNKIVNQDKDKAKKERDNLLNQLKTLQEQGLTKDNLESLQARIDELTNEGKSREQLAKEKEDRLIRQYTTDIEKHKGSSERWQKLYADTRIDTEIFQAAGSKKARNPDQIRAILKPLVSLREDLGEDKKPTGTYTPRVKWSEKDKEGNPVVLDLSVTEAVSRMYESEDHANLFDSGGTGGLGNYSGTTKPGGKKDLSELTPEEYYRQTRGKGK
jgi:hypothetical protein